MRQVAVLKGHVAMAPFSAVWMMRIDGESRVPINARSFVEALSAGPRAWGEAGNSQDPGALRCI